MSGVAGIFLRDGRPARQDEVSKMAEAMARRGPDHRGAWTLGSASLASCMLRTTPESLLEEYPLSPDGLIAITADVRLDNRQDLIAHLGMAHEDPKETTDGRLILRAYQRWGEECAGYLLGDFAFAIWDGREQRLFCARDIMGVKPFYYFTSPRVFRFASEIKALLLFDDVTRNLNEEAVVAYLSTQLETKENTLYREISRLAPASTLTVTARDLVIRQYWRLDPTRETRLASSAEYADRFRELFTEAVKCRLRSVTPVGSLLSGGLDSSSIVCTARQLEPARPLHTFSAIFDTLPQCDEREYISEVIRQANPLPHYLLADRLSPLGDVDRYYEFLDEAVYPPNLFMHWGLFDLAHETGVRVMLDGIDGDSVVSHGSYYLTELALRFKFGRLWKEARARSRRTGLPLSKLLWTYAGRPLAPDWLAFQARRFKRRVAHVRDPALLINKALARRIHLSERIQNSITSGGKLSRTEREEHHHRLTWPLAPLILETEDGAGAACELEPRYPFYDRRLMEFCLSVPPEQKLSDGWSRMIFRRAMEGVLPAKIQWRVLKTNLSANFLGGFQVRDRERVEAALADRDILAPFVDLDVLQNSWRDLQETGNEYSAVEIWRAVMLILWLQRPDHS